MEIPEVGWGSKIKVLWGGGGGGGEGYFLDYPFGNSGFFKRGENRSTRRETSRSKGQNHQQTQPTYSVEAGI